MAECRMMYQHDIASMREDARKAGLAEGLAARVPHRKNAKLRNKIYPIKWTQQEEGFLENGHKKKG